MACKEHECTYIPHPADARIHTHTDALNDVFMTYGYELFGMLFLVIKQHLRHRSSQNYRPYFGQNHMPPSVWLSPLGQQTHSPCLHAICNESAGMPWPWPHWRDVTNTTPMEIGNTKICT